MPITKSAIKQMRQSRVRQARNQHYKSHMKSMVKLILGYVKNNEPEKALKVLPKVASALDTAAKKGLIHRKNANNKKSKIQEKVTKLVGKKAPKAA